MENTYNPRHEPQLSLERFTPEGRAALRSWYKFYRTDVRLDRHNARQVVRAMAHASQMGPHWYKV